MAWALQPLGSMADTRKKFELKDTFIRALAAMLAEDPSLGDSQAQSKSWRRPSVQKPIARARYEELPKAG
jgi:hypothetical protein